MALDAGVTMAGASLGMQSHRRGPVRSECGLAARRLLLRQSRPGQRDRYCRSSPGRYVLPDRLRGMARYLPPVQAAAIAAYERYGPLGPSDVIVRATEHIGPHHGHGSETIVDLVIKPQQRMVRVRVLSVGALTPS